MDKLVKIWLLSGSLLYFTLCVVTGAEVSHELHKIMIALFILFGVIVVLRYLVLLTAAILEKYPTRRHAAQSSTPFITIVVPAFNEEKLIEASLRSLAQLDYPYYEIIVVDDGSNDATVNVVSRTAQNISHTQIRIISQSNSGKSSALNTGIMHAQGDIVVCIDSDSRLHPDSLKFGIVHFDDPRVGAVGGYVNVINNQKLITRLQQLEYMIGLNFLRRGLSYFNLVTVVPGPIGMFRKRAIQQLGGYNTRSDCFAEDADLTVRLLLNGWRVKGETHMIADTEAPETLYALLRQRYRWKRGIFQAFFANFYSLLISPSLRGLIIAGILSFESFLFDLIGFGLILFSLSSFLVFAKFEVFFLAFAVISVLDLIVFIFTSLEHGQIINKFSLFLLQKISYAYILLAWSTFALFDELASTSMSWDKLERTGTSALGKQV